MELFDDTENIRDERPINIDITALYELCIDAFYAALYADMSELPVKAEIGRYIEKVKKAGNITGGKSEKDRAAAAKAASDRGDPDVLIVLKTAARVTTEIHRLTGMLRFSPDANGTYIARCSPDHFILPALEYHFTMRFGDTPWAIIDEKRGLCLFREAGKQARIVPLDDAYSSAGILNNGNSGGKESRGTNDHWEDLWRLYYRSVNNEARKNPRLQRQFMPERYQKYLIELQ